MQKNLLKKKLWSRICKMSSINKDDSPGGSGTHGNRRLHLKIKTILRSVLNLMILRKLLFKFLQARHLHKKWWDTVDSSPNTVCRKYNKDQSKDPGPTKGATDSCEGNFEFVRPNSIQRVNLWMLSLVGMCVLGENSWIKCFYMHISGPPNPHRVSYPHWTLIWESEQKYSDWNG